jgi:hypothetical protein
MLNKITGFNKFLLTFALAFVANNAHAASVSDDVLAMAGEQRELTQQTAKDYMYIGQHIFEARARKSLETRLARMEHNQAVLRQAIKDNDSRDLLDYADIQFKEYKASLETPYGAESASLVMDNSDVLLEIYDEVLKKMMANDHSHFLQLYGMANSQSVRIARIGKFYLAQKDGITDYNSKKQIQSEIVAFEKTKALLEQEKANPGTVADGLNEVNHLWRLVRGFFLDVNKEDLPIVVDTSTNSLQKSMDKIAKHYLKAQRS